MLLLILGSSLQAKGLVYTSAVNCSGILLIGVLDIVISSICSAMM